LSVLTTHAASEQKESTEHVGRGQPLLDELSEADDVTGDDGEVSVTEEELEDVVSAGVLLEPNDGVSWEELLGPEDIVVSAENESELDDSSVDE